MKLKSKTMKTLYLFLKSLINEKANQRSTFYKVKMILAGLLAFTIYSSNSQPITLLSPNGGENWMSNTTQTISWQLDGGYEDLYIEYSIDNGQYWYYLGYISAYDSVNELTFTGYLIASDSALVRISKYSDPDISDQSDGIFSISENPVYFYTPSAGQQIYGGVDIMLSWYSYTIDTFDVSYTLDGGATWNQIASAATENNLIWTTPTTITEDAMIRITDVNYDTLFGLSPTFSIIDPPTAVVITPNGGETWEYGSTATVSWSGTNLPYYIYIDFSSDGGQTWDYLGFGYGNETGGSTEVYVPYINTDSAKIRLLDPYYDLVFDESDQLFTIFVPPVIMYNPYEGQQFYIKDQMWVSWLATGVTEVNIELSTDGGSTWSIIDENIDAESGWYQWTISGTPSTDCFIRISDALDATKFGLSGQFTLLETPVIALTNPIGGEIWNTDSTYVISWTNNNPDAYYVYVEYSSDTGQTWNYLGYASNTDGQGSQEWKTPNIESDYYMIRVTDSYLDFVSDTSGIFSIKSFPSTPICIVSVDSSTNHNVVVWERPVSDLIDSFIIYRESDISETYEQIGFVSYASETVFSDTNSNPAIKSYRYKLGFSDAEGNIYPKGPFHQTIHLAINKGVGNNWNLIWTDYIGFNVATYNIYRSVNNNNYEMIASISSSFNSYTDIDAPEGSVYYFVEVINENGCNLLSRGISNSLSNIATNSALGINDNEFLDVSIYPNPATGLLNINLPILNKSVNLQLFDLTGKMIKSRKIEENYPGGKLIMDVSDVKPGVFFVKMQSENKTLTRKIIINN